MAWQIYPCYLVLKGMQNFRCRFMAGSVVLSLIPSFMFQDVLSSHLPESPNIEFDSSRNPNIKPYSNEKEHPYYHERPAYSYLARSYYPKYRQLDHAKVIPRDDTINLYI